MDEHKTRWVQLWLSKAVSDLNSAKALAAPETEIFDTAVYHCQQAAEKALKGFLSFMDRPVARTHDVEDLIQQALAVEPGFANFVSDATTVKPFAIGFRYPSMNVPLQPDRADVDEALAASQRIFDFVLSLLPTETHPA